MKFIERFRSIRIGTQISLACTLVSLISIAAVSIADVALARQRLRGHLESKAVLYSQQLGAQMQSVVEYNDAKTARDLFDSFSNDSDILGLAIFDESGEIIEGFGKHPERLSLDTAMVSSATGVIEVISRIVANQGASGQLYVRLSKQRIVIAQRNSVAVAFAMAACGLVLSIALSIPISRRFNSRLLHIVEVATDIASGNINPAPIDDTSKDEIGDLAAAVNRMSSELQRMFNEISILNEKRHNIDILKQEQLQQIVVQRTSDLEASENEAKIITERFEFAITGTSDGLWDWDLQTNVVFCSPRFKELVGFNQIYSEITDIFSWMNNNIHPDDRDATISDIHNSIKSGEAYRSVYRLLVAENTWRWFESRGAPVRNAAGRSIRLAGAITDITERKEGEQALHLAARMASVGTLASGIAHEINTPIQFINDSVQFLRDASSDVFTLVAKLQEVRRLAASGAPGPVLNSAIEIAECGEREADLEYLHEHMPKAFERCADGLERVSTIVRSMKEFAHPSVDSMAPVDLNRAIANTLTIARSEYKYVAEIVVDYGNIPFINCYVNEINQVVLNIVVNAAHAIGEAVKGTDNKGKITVRTYSEDEFVVISISDTGKGIPDAVGKRIFEPFFTTKEVGKGTGQGLALAWAVVKEKHGGSLSFETVLNNGTTFFIRLLIAGVPANNGARGET
jgi:PAS domain S-box-containing protein